MYGSTNAMGPEFSTGGMLSKSFSIWFRNLIPFTIISLVVYSPLLIYTWMVVGSFTLHGFSNWGYSLYFVPRVLGMIATGAVTYGVFQQLRGQNPSIGKSVAVGLTRLVPALLVSLVVFIAVGLGTVALFIPGVILSCMLFVAVPASVIESAGVAESLKRSQQLTDGYKWGIFGTLFLLGILQFVVMMVIQGATIGMRASSIGEVQHYMIFMTLFLVVSGSLQAVVGAVAYHDLRVAKEGVATEELARVFD
jgi:hypothetical protein